MANSLIRLEIVTPGGVAYSEEVEHAVIPTANGKVDILQHHAPLIDRLVPADVKVVNKDKKIDYLAMFSSIRQKSLCVGQMALK